MKNPEMTFDEIVEYKLLRAARQPDAYWASLAAVAGHGDARLCRTQHCDREYVEAMERRRLFAEKARWWSTLFPATDASTLPLAEIW